MKNLGHQDPPVPGGYTGMTNTPAVLKMHSVTYLALASKGLIDMAPPHSRPVGYFRGYFIEVSDKHPRNPLAEELCKLFSTLR